MMSDFAIESDIPIPTQRSKYPFRDLKVGQSFFAGGKTSTQMTNAARNFRPMKFTVRQTVENGETGTRVWRVS